MSTGDFIAVVPTLAAAFAVPQFVPQLLRVLAGDDAGVSWSWATLTCINNAAWCVYFVAAHYWFGLAPAGAAVTLAGSLALVLTGRGRATPRGVVMVSAWATALICASQAAGTPGLGALLAGSFVVQVAPSLWTAYTTPRPSGLSPGTWALTLGELTCWAVFGVYHSDIPLTIIGLTGTTASLLMLLRAWTVRTTR